MTTESKMTAKRRRQLARTLEWEPDAEFLASQSDEALNSLKAECDQHRVRFAWLTSVGTVAWPSLLLALAVTAYLTAISPRPLPAKDLASIWSIVPTVLTVGFLVAGYALRAVVTAVLGLDSSKQISEALAPLNSCPYFCRNVLDSLNSSAQARAYRDRVVAQGRELRVADGRVIFNLALDDRKARAAAEAREVCQQVHGILQG